MFGKKTEVIALNAVDTFKSLTTEQRNEQYPCSCCGAPAKYGNSTDTTVNTMCSNPDCRLHDPSSISFWLVVEKRAIKEISED